MAPLWRRVGAVPPRGSLNGFEIRPKVVELSRFRAGAGCRLTGTKHESRRAGHQRRDLGPSAGEAGEVASLESGDGGDDS